MSTTGGVDPAQPETPNLERWWSNASRKQKGWTIAAGCAGVVILWSWLGGPSESDEYAATAETITMQSVAGVDTATEACEAGYDWTCVITETDYKPVNSVYVYTELPAADAQSARLIAFAYYRSIPDLEEVVVVNRGGVDFPGTTRQDLAHMPGL